MEALCLIYNVSQARLGFNSLPGVGLGFAIYGSSRARVELEATV